MATGDITWFRRALLDLGLKRHDLASDAIKLGLVTGTTTPTATTADPRWGAGGSINFAANQVATGSSYPDGGPALASQDWDLVSDVPTLRADNIAIAVDAGGFDNARWGIFYNDSDASKRAIAFLDLGEARSIQSVGLSFDWSGADQILRITTP